MLIAHFYQKLFSFFLRILCIIGVLTMIGCSQKIEKYQNTTPEIDIFKYFEGNTQAWGMVQDYSNQQVRRFFVTIKGTVAGQTLTLNEHFIYDDGEKQQRTWTINRLKDGTYEGTAGDIHGIARGRSVGNAFNWRYAMDVKTDKRTIRLNFDDWIYQQDERHLFNVTALNKWGIQVAQVTLFFEKLDALPEPVSKKDSESKLESNNTP